MFIIDYEGSTADWTGNLKVSENGLTLKKIEFYMIILSCRLGFSSDVFDKSWS